MHLCTNNRWPRISYSFWLIQLSFPLVDNLPNTCPPFHATTAGSSSLGGGPMRISFVNPGRSSRNLSSRYGPRPVILPPPPINMIPPKKSLILRSSPLAPCVMDVRIAMSRGITGKVLSRSSAALIFSSVGSKNILVLSASATPSTFDRTSAGCGVPSGAGEPATDDLGVPSASLRRFKRLNLLGVAVTGFIVFDSRGVSPFSVAFLPAAY